MSGSWCDFGALMRVAAFLDVDGVLTATAINLQYAQLLGVEEQIIELERRFAVREIDNDQFNAVLIPLFRRAGFSRQFARDNFEKVNLRIDAAELLAAAPDTFIVTSGPSYFIDIMANRFRLRQQNALCSRYEFDREGLLSRCVRPVTSTMKGMFVRERAAHFEISVGVGDTEHDFEFLGHCDIPVWMGEKQAEYLSALELRPVVGVIQSLRMAVSPATSTARLPGMISNRPRRKIFSS
jgi:phosphoserine phosphatase